MARHKAAPLAETYKTFLVDRKARGFSPGTIRYYEDKLGQFVRWAKAEGAQTVDQVTPALVRTYLVHLQDRGLKENTVAGASRAVHAFGNWLAAEGLVKVSPTANIPYPKMAKRILPAFTAEEVKRLLTAAPDARARAAILFLLDTGVRAAECVKLDGRDIDLKTGAVQVREGKGRKDRTVYMGARSRRALLAYFGAEGWPEADEAVWRNQQTGERLTDSGLRQLLAAVGKDARVSACTPHTFRRTFALESLRGGMNIYALARLMGHNDIQVLRQYLPLVEGDLQAAHEKAAPVDRLLK